MPGFERWQKSWDRLGAPAPGILLYEQLIARYSEPHRAYHTVQHLEECFRKLTELEDHAQHLGEVELALWFHDAVYDVKRTDNEAKSAHWARAVALQAGVAKPAAQRIHSLVLVTAHEAIASDVDQQIVVDVDLSILGAPSERFEEYERQIRTEYAWVPEDLFRERRCEILAQFLARPKIFSTKTFLERYEARARENLARSLAALN